MRNLISPTMSGIIHNQRSGGLILLNGSCYVRIGVACRRRFALESIPHNLLYHITGIPGSHIFGRIVKVCHVQVVVSVVSHKHQCVLPSACLVVQSIRNGFIYQYFSLFFGGYRKSAHCQIELVRLIGCHPFTIVQQTEKAVVDITKHLVKRVFAFKTKQIIVCSSLSPFACVHPIIPRTIAEKQQITRHIGIGVGTVVQHFEITAIGIGIRRTTTKLVKKLV